MSDKPARTIVIMEMLDAYDNNGHRIFGTKELKVSHGMNENTMENVVLPPVTNPIELGATYDMTINEWVIEN